MYSDEFVGLLSIIVGYSSDIVVTFMVIRLYSLSMATSRTTVSLSEETLDRIKSVKPYDTMTHDEFFNDVLDRIEERGRDE